MLALSRAIILVLCTLTSITAHVIAQSHPYGQSVHQTPSAYDLVRGSPYKVSYDSRALLINGDRVLLQSGSVHYPRAPPDMWKPIIDQARQHGLNMIQTYVHWNVHEPVKGQYDFSSEGRNLSQFIQYAADAGLFVHLRIGPYICAEWNLGGIPAWMKFESNMTFRTNNVAWLNAMRTFVERVVEEVEPHLARNGGPIVAVQLENEYGNVEGWYGPDGRQYVLEVADMARSLHLDVPIVMCQQRDAPQDIITTCNGFYCDQWIRNEHVIHNPTQPSWFTENWNGWYAQWGESVPHRPVSDTMFSISRFIMLGGSMHNYYMFFGGTNFARWVGGPGIMTSYDYDAALNEYGLPNPDKFNQLRTLHMMLYKYETALMSENQLPPIVKLGDMQEATTYGGNASVSQSHISISFLANSKWEEVTVNFPPDSSATYTLPPWSVTFVDGQSDEVVFNTQNGPFEQMEERMATPSILTNDEDGVEVDMVGREHLTIMHPTRSKPSSSPAAAAADVAYQCAFDVLGLWNWDHLIASSSPLEQFNLTRDHSDYLLYATNVTLTPAMLNAGKAVLELSNVGDYIMLQIVQHQSMSALPSPIVVIRQAVGMDSSKFTIPLPGDKKWNVGEAQLLILTQTLGMQNYGPFLESVIKGLTPLSVIAFGGQSLQHSEWFHQPGLLGEHRNYWMLSPSSPVWQPRDVCDFGLKDRMPLMWFNIQMQLDLESDPSAVFALDLSSMGKGMAWVNERMIGRYWLINATAGSLDDCDACAAPWVGPYNEYRCRRGCGEPTQSLYHVPRSYLLNGWNTIVLMEENVDDHVQPALVTLRKVN